MWFERSKWYVLAANDRGVLLDHNQKTQRIKDPKLAEVFEYGRNILSRQVKVDIAFSLGCLQTKECKEVLTKMGFDTSHGNFYTCTQVEKIYDKGRSLGVDWASQNVKEYLRCVMECQLGLSFNEG